jgi:lipoprotein-releasing system permease protein
MAKLATDTKPFAPFEWMLALRYLRARRSEGFISVLAGFSFLGILLGVFTLITVMAVMNGFRKELFSKILGLNGHIIVHKVGGDDFENYGEAARRLAMVPGIKQVLPLVEGQAMASMPHLAVAGLVRGMREDDLKSVPLVGGNVRFGTLDGFDRQEGVAIGTRLASSLRVNAGDSITLITPR